MDFIERIFGVSPDAGDGSTEALWIAVVLAIAVMAFARWRARRRPVSDVHGRACPEPATGPVMAIRQPRRVERSRLTAREGPVATWEDGCATTPTRKAHRLDLSVGPHLSPARNEN
jgi:hypothetical protein